MDSRIVSDSMQNSADSETTSKKTSKKEPKNSDIYKTAKKRVQNSLSFSCQSLLIAENYIDDTVINGTIWEKDGINDGSKQLYKCSVVNCNAKLALFMHKLSDHVTAYTSDTHDHNDVLQHPKIIEKYNLIQQERNALNQNLLTNQVETISNISNPKEDQYLKINNQNLIPLGSNISITAFTKNQDSQTVTLPDVNIIKVVNSVNKDTQTDTFQNQHIIKLVNSVDKPTITDAAPYQHIIKLVDSVNRDTQTDTFPYQQIIKLVDSEHKDTQTSSELTRFSEVNHEAVRKNTVHDHLLKQKIEFEKRLVLKNKAHSIELRTEIERRQEIEKLYEAQTSTHIPLVPQKGRIKKKYYELSNRSKLDRRVCIRETLNESMEILKPMGLSLGKVEIFPTPTTETLELDSLDSKHYEKFNLIVHGEDDEYKNQLRIKKLMYFKDKNGISDRVFTDLQKCDVQMPSLYFVKKFRDQIDTKFKIYNNQIGVYLSMKDKLSFRLQIFFNKKYGKKDNLNDKDIFVDHIIHVKICSDGTNIGRNLKLLNLTFTILNEGDAAKQATGNYTIGIFEIENECHKVLVDAFKGFNDEITNLNEIEVDYQETNKKTVKIVFYQGGDWKMLANSLGIKCANSKYPCVWCKCPKEDFWNLEKSYSIYDTNLSARSHSEQFAILTHPDQQKIQTFGYAKMPIFKDIIPISRYVIDMLHLFLRITDTLFNLLVKDCCLADNFDMGKISKFVVSKYKHMNSLQHFLNEKCNVGFTFLWAADTKKLTWRDMYGPEKIRFIENFDLSQIFPDHEKFESLSKIWLEFWTILRLVKAVEIEASDLKKRAYKWLELYLTVYSRATITPYMHAFVYHLHEFVFLFKDVNAFNCQGLEKLNDMTTGQYFKGTNKKESALHQMLSKRSRMEYLRFLCHEDL